MAEYYASIPTYIPPVSLGSDYPAYSPATTKLTRSRSNRIVYADDPWNSATNPELLVPQRRLSSERAQQRRRLTKTKRPPPPSITSLFSSDNTIHEEQMTSSRADLPPSLRPGAGLYPYSSTAPPHQSTFKITTERTLSFQSDDSFESQHSISPIQRRTSAPSEQPKTRPKALQPTSVPTSRPRVSPPPSPAPAGAGTPATLIPGSRFSSNLGAIDIWADIRSTLDRPAPKHQGKRRPLIQLSQAQETPVARPSSQRQPAPVARPTQLPGPSRQELSPPRAERRSRPTSAPADGSLSRQRTHNYGDWVVVPSARPSSMPSFPASEERRPTNYALPPTIPQLQLGAPFPILINKRISHIQQDEGVAVRSVQEQRSTFPATPTPSRAPPAPKPSTIETQFDIPVETTAPSVAPLAVTRQPSSPSRKETTDTTWSPPASRSNTLLFAESAQLTPSPSLTAAIQSVTREMKSVHLSEGSESGSVVQWDVVDTVLKKQGAGRRKSLPQVMRRPSLKLTSASVESVDDCIGCVEGVGVCGHVGEVEVGQFVEEPQAEYDSFDEEEEHSDVDSDSEELYASWEEEDRSASPTKVVSEAVKRLREEKRAQDQLWNDVKGLLASRGRQGSCETTTTLSSIEADLLSPTSNYST